MEKDAAKNGRFGMGYEGGKFLPFPHRKEIFPIAGNTA